MNPNLIRYLMILLVAPFVWSCSSEDPEPVFEATPYTLVDAQLKLTWTTADLKGFVDLGGIDLDEDKLKYNTSIYRVVYKTDYKGDSIDASAIVMLPETEDQVSTVSFQHGTIASDLEAPTNLKLGNNQMILLSILASTGLVVVVPDYIGFGESVEIMHPYYVEDLTATSVVNAIYASRQLVNQKNTNIDSDLYLAGYSQGGYATMATHKFFEEKGMQFYELKASFPASGGYDVKAFQEYFFQLETFHSPFFMAYVANAYKVSFDWSESLDLFFNEPYASEIPTLFDGSMNGDQIDAKLSQNINELVNEDFINGIDTEMKYAFVRNAFIDNSLTDWVPSIRMFMYHGDADITVPYQNSVDVYHEFIANGASEEIVTFTTIQGGTHIGGAGPWAFSLLEEIEKLEAND